MANEFIIRKGYKSLSSSEITGSLDVSVSVHATDVFVIGHGSVSASLSNITNTHTNFSASVSTRFEGLTTDYTELDNIPDNIASELKGITVAAKKLAMKSAKNPKSSIN